MGAQAEFCEKKTGLEVQVFTLAFFDKISLRRKVGTQCKNGPKRALKETQWS